MNRRASMVLTLVLVLALSAAAALLAGDSRPGSDDRATGAIEALTGEAYEPWAQPPGVPGGEGSRPLLVGVQAFAGLAVLAGCIWYWREHRSGA